MVLQVCRFIEVEFSSALDHIGYGVQAIRHQMQRVVRQIRRPVRREQ